MIIKALADYYERMLNDPACDIAPPGFEQKPIPFLIVLNGDGKVVNVRSTATGEGKKKTVRSFLLPQGEKKASGIKANLLWDNPQYVLGLPKSDKPKDAERAVKAYEAFAGRINELFPDEAPDGICAVQRFLEAKDFSKIEASEYWDEIKETMPNMTFVLQGETQLVAEHPAVVEQVKQCSAGSDADVQICAVTGQDDAPAILHTAIKGVWGAQTSGANIVSFNQESFCSFNKWKKQGLNAPIGQHAVFAYTTALNTLLKKGSNQRMQVGDASTVFWAKEPDALENDFSFFLSEPPKGEEAVSYAKIKELLSAVRTGVRPDEELLPFYVLGLSPNASRIAIRFWYEGTVKKIKECVALHFSDIEIARASYDREYLSLFQLLLSTATAGKADNIPPNLGGDLVRAVLGGTLYPRTLLANAVRRCKAEQRVTHAQAAVIKGVLTREARFKKLTKEVEVALDKTNENTGYVLGRLFAALERIQEQAQSGLNKTIRDTYFGAACSSPLVTFTRLQGLAIHHLAKIRNSGKSTVWLEQLMQEIVGLLSAEGIPSVLSLEDQGRFSIGYYHQRHDFFTKKESTEEGDE